MNFSEKQLAHNVRLYGWIRMLLMRAYLPLIAIYLVDVGHITVGQLGILGAIAAITSLVANVPTGYLADKWTRKSAIVAGALMLAMGAALFAAFPSFPGAVAATICEALGFSIVSGAREAIIHDSLQAFDRVHQYVRITGRAQSFALTGNIVLVGLVPLTYGINERLPFAIGAIASLVFVLIARTLHEPPRPKTQVATTEPYNLVRVLRIFVNRRTIVFFIALGMLSSAYKAYPPFVNLALQDLGLEPSLLGLMFAAASVVGAINGRLVHHFKRISLLQYSLFDVCMASGFLFVVGLTHNLWLILATFVFNMGFWRIRSIMYQDHLLRRFGNHHYKATLISTMGFFDAVNFWQSLAFAFIVGWVGYYHGFILIGMGTLAIIGTLFVIGARLLPDEQKGPSRGVRPTEV